MTASPAEGACACGTRSYGKDTTSAETFMRLQHTFIREGYHQCRDLHAPAAHVSPGGHHGQMILPQSGYVQQCLDGILAV